MFDFFKKFKKSVKPVVAEFPPVTSCIVEKILEDLKDVNGWKKSEKRMLTNLVYKETYILNYFSKYDFDLEDYKASNIGLVGLYNSPFTQYEQNLLSKAILALERNIRNKVGLKEKSEDLRQLKKMFPGCYKKKK